MLELQNEMSVTSPEVYGTGIATSEARSKFQPVPLGIERCIIPKSTLSWGNAYNDYKYGISYLFLALIYKKP